MAWLVQVITLQKCFGSVKLCIVISINNKNFTAVLHSGQLKIRKFWVGICLFALWMTTWEAERSGMCLESGRSRDHFLLSPSKSYQGFTKLVREWLPCQMPCTVWSVLDLAGLVSIYYGWVRQQTWSATCLLVRCHAHISEQIFPWDTLCMLLECYLRLDHSQDNL